MLKIIKLATVLTVMSAYALVHSATAGINCRDGYQIMPNGGLHASPYCQLQQLVAIAHKSYGVSTSVQSLRESEAEREKVCQFAGHDHRIDHICQQHLNGGEFPGLQ